MKDGKQIKSVKVSAIKKLSLKEAAQLRGGWRGRPGRWS